MMVIVCFDYYSCSAAQLITGTFHFNVNKSFSMTMRIAPYRVTLNILAETANRATAEMPNVNVLINNTDI